MKEPSFYFSLFFLEENPPPLRERERNNQMTIVFRNNKILRKILQALHNYLLFNKFFSNGLRIPLVVGPRYHAPASVES